MLVEQDVSPSRSSVDDPAGIFSRRRRRGQAAVTEDLGSRSGGRLGLRRMDHGDLDDVDLFSLDRMEEGEVGTIGSFKIDKRGIATTSGAAVSGGEIMCTLIDPASGRQHIVPFAGVLPDWQMGFTPLLHRGDMYKDGKGGIDGRVRRRDEYGDRSMKWGEEAPTTKKHVLLFRVELPEAARPWSAEDPQLYTVVVGLAGGGREEGGKRSSLVGQFESAKVGFRNVRVASGQLLVNGRAVMLAGVNRHEHDPDHGKTVSEASMKRDIVMMKRCLCT